MIKALLWVIGRRTVTIIPILLIVSAMVFGALRVLPVDPAKMSLPPSATLEDIDATRVAMGLDRPIWEQYLGWLAQTLRGDLGTSTQFRQPVADLVIERLPDTIELTLAAMLAAVVSGMMGGLALFLARGGAVEAAGLTATSALMSLPDFLLGLSLILTLGVGLQWLPITGRLSAGFSVPPMTGFLTIDALLTGEIAVFGDVLLHMIMPALALGLSFAPLIIRVLHTSLISQWQESYVEQARLRGLGPTHILFRHALKNALLPVVMLIGVNLGALFGGTLLIELIFGIPGLGNLMLSAVQTADLPVIQSVAMLFCLATLLSNSLADAAAIILNPRLRRAT